MPFPGGTYLGEMVGRVRDEFDALHAQIEGYLRSEHKADGSHGVIHERGRESGLGDWVDIPYEASLYTAPGMTWTVAEAEQKALGYELSGGSCTVAFEISASDVTTAGSARTSLRIKLPPAIIANRKVANTFAYISGATYGIGIVEVFHDETDGSYLRLLRDLSGTNWDVAGSGNCYVQGEIRFGIRDL